MAIIKPMLAEELKNSEKLKGFYEKELRKLPEGVISVKKIKGKKYHYLVKREKGKHKTYYKGIMAEEEVAVYGDAKKKRAKLRNMLSKVKKQIKYLKGALRGKEPV